MSKISKSTETESRLCTDGSSSSVNDFLCALKEHRTPPLVSVFILKFTCYISVKRDTIS